MASFKFLHTADLHLDSPLERLELYEGAPAERIRNATRAAFENVVALALSQQVDFVVIAGDLFDGKWTDIQTGLWTNRQFRRLEREEIPVYLLRGNHDALSDVPRRMSWPANVHEFAVDSPQTFLLDGIPLALHGQGFAQREVTVDLADGYPDPVPDHFNIGVLHTSLAGDPDHDSYAPTSEDRLAAKGYDYWALGHIHRFEVIRESPGIVYPGCTQGRHVRESGAKGCVVVHVENGRAQPVFHEIDTLRWETLNVEIAEDQDLSDVYLLVENALIECKRRTEDHFLAVRIILQGTSAFHTQLRSRDGSEEAIMEIRNFANALDETWVEKVLIQTQPPVDLSRIRQGRDLIGEVLREFERLQTAEEDVLANLAAELDPIVRKSGSALRDVGIDLKHPQNIRNWLAQAESTVISRLAETGDET